MLIESVIKMVLTNASLLFGLVLSISLLAYEVQSARKITTLVQPAKKITTANICQVVDVCYYYDLDIITSKERIAGNGKLAPTYSEVCSAYKDCAKPSTPAGPFLYPDDICQSFSKCRGSMDIPDTLTWIDHAQWLCPSVNFCRNVSELDTGMPQESCCSSCSCAPDCGRHHECCYASDDRFNVVETENLKCLPVQTTLQELSFYMVHTCPNGKRCMEPDEDILPVSSFSRRRIYASKSCAVCNAVLDFEAWNMLITYNANGIKLNDLVDHVRQKEASLSSYDAALVPPSTRDITWIKNFICNELEVSDESFQNQDMLEACNSIRAPYVPMSIFNDNLTVYRNVHCAIGDSADYSFSAYKVGDCDFFNFPFLGRGIGKTRTTVLDMSIIEAYKGPSTTSDPSDQKCREGYVATNHSKETCKPVLCPHGMVFNSERQCHYAVLKLKDASYAAHFMVTASKVLDMILVREVLGSTSFYDGLATACPFLQGKLFILYLSLVERIGETLVDDAFLTVVQERVEGVLENFVNDVRICFNKTFTLPLNSTSLSFQIRLASNKIDDLHAADTKPANTMFLIGPAVDFSSYFALTKGYFCDQVELNQDEFKREGRQIRILRNNKILGDNQYDFVGSAYLNDTDLSNVRVCLEDFQEKAQGNGLDEEWYTNTDDGNVETDKLTPPSGGGTTSLSIITPPHGNVKPPSGTTESPSDTSRPSSGSVTPLPGSKPPSGTAGSSNPDVGANASSSGAGVPSFGANYSLLSAVCIISALLLQSALNWMKTY